ncbi:hypothetical protein ACFX13_017135 [Malus domestica]
MAEEEHPLTFSESTDEDAKLGGCGRD